MKDELNIENFIKNFASQLEETDISKVNAKTKFHKEIEEWDSFKALSVIAMVDKKYNVNLKGEDIRNSNTIEDLFKIVIAKK